MFPVKYIHEHFVAYMHISVMKREMRISTKADKLLWNRYRKLQRKVHTDKITEKIKKGLHPGCVYRIHHRHEEGEGGGGGGFRQGVRQPQIYPVAMHRGGARTVPQRAYMAHDHYPICSPSGSVIWSDSSVSPQIATPISNISSSRTVTLLPSISTSQTIIIHIDTPL